MNVQRHILGCGPLLLLLFPLVVACQSSEKEQATARQLSFEVVDSLLGPVYEVTSALKSFQPPVGFAPVSDSLLAILREKFVREGSPEGKVDFIQFFFDPQHSAGLIVSTVRDLNLTTDTTAFIARYRRAILAEYGKDRVMAGDYWVESIYVKNFLVTDSAQVRFQLLCLTPEGDALELQYVVPRAVYPAVLKSLESSIGSLKPIYQGG